VSREVERLKRELVRACDQRLSEDNATQLVEQFRDACIAEAVEAARTSRRKHGGGFAIEQDIELLIRGPIVERNERLDHIQRVALMSGGSARLTDSGRVRVVDSVGRSAMFSDYHKALNWITGAAEEHS
jgi:hypothetical protein